MLGFEDGFLGFEDGFASASPWIDAITEIVDDLATVRGEAAIGTKDTACIGVRCQGGIRGIDVMVLIASACVVAGVITAVAIRSHPRLRLAVVGSFRTAGDAATTLAHRFAAPFNSRE
ncbi:MAG TPA: hypothetical protein VFZ75_09305 [Actinomycetota bacterium]|nr:hypothetical protein [Actinomycetota bacterium]